MCTRTTFPCIQARWPRHPRLRACALDTSATPFWRYEGWFSGLCGGRGRELGLEALVVALLLEVESMVRRSLCELYLCYRAWEHILLRRWQSTQKGSYDEPDLAGWRSGVGDGIWSLHVSKTVDRTGSRPGLLHGSETWWMGGEQLQGMLLAHEEEDVRLALRPPLTSAPRFLC